MIHDQEGGGSRAAEPGSSEGYRARKDLGQHFLVSSQVLDRIEGACRDFAQKSTAILEIGPGKGALTERLRELGPPVWAVEADPELVTSLRGDFPDVRVFNADARELDLVSLSAQAGRSPWLVAGNLPYNAGTDILRRVLHYTGETAAVVVMLQKEVARKFCAGPGDEAYGLIGAWTAVWWEPVFAFTVKPGAFRPQPKVTSAVCTFVPKRDPPLPRETMDRFRTFLQKAFAHPRKTLRRNLGRDLDLPDSPVRPADLSPGEYVSLFLESQFGKPGITAGGGSALE